MTTTRKFENNEKKRQTIGTNTNTKMVKVLEFYRGHDSNASMNNYKHS